MKIQFSFFSQANKIDIFVQEQRGFRQLLRKLRIINSFGFNPLEQLSVVGISLLNKIFFNVAGKAAFFIFRGNYLPFHLVNMQSCTAFADKRVYLYIFIFIQWYFDVFLSLCIIELFAGCYHGVKLRNHDSAFSNGSEFPSGQFIQKVTEGIVIFLFSFWLLNGELQLTRNLSHEEIVDNDVVSRIVQLVFDPGQFELPLHALVLIKEVHSLEDVDKSTLAALQLRPHDVPDLESHQVDIEIVMMGVLLYSHFQQRMNQTVDVAQHQ